MSVLKFRDESDKFVGILSIKGDKGDPGGLYGHASQHAIGGSDVLTPEAIGAASDMHSHTPEEIGASPANHSHTADEIGAATADHSHTAEEIGASREGHNHDDRYYSKAETDSKISSGDITWKVLADVDIPNDVNGYAIALSKNLGSFSEARIIVNQGASSASTRVRAFTGTSGEGTYLGKGSVTKTRYGTISMPCICQIDGQCLIAVDNYGWETTSAYASGGTLISGEVNSLYVRLDDDTKFRTGGRVIVIAR